MRMYRIANYLGKRLRELGLGSTRDPRKRRGRRWGLCSVYAGILSAMMSGRRSFGDMERMTKKLSPQARRVLSIPRRLPDTTARDTTCRLSHQSPRVLLRKAVQAAKRRKVFRKKPGGFPIGVMTFDGKVTAIQSWDSPYVQRQMPENGKPYGLVRTVTSTLASHGGRICIDASPIPAHTNEMGHFQTAFADVCEYHSDLFDLATYDAGANSEANALAVLAAGKHYMFRMKDERREMTRLSQELLDDSPVMATTTDVVSNRESTRRELRMLRVFDHSNSPHKSFIWSHTKTILRVDSITVLYDDEGNVVSETTTRLYCSSMPSTSLKPDYWLATVRMHWQVELLHQALDVALLEDEHPWIVADANGALVLVMLRRLAYTLLALLRNVALKSEENRAMPWTELLEQISDTLKSDAKYVFEGLKPISETIATK